MSKATPLLTGQLNRKHKKNNHPANHMEHVYSGENVIKHKKVVGEQRYAITDLFRILIKFVCNKNKPTQ